MKTNRSTSPQKTSKLRLPAPYSAAQESRDAQVNISLTDKEMLALLTLADQRGEKPAITARLLLLSALGAEPFPAPIKTKAKIKTKIKVARRRAVPIAMPKPKSRPRSTRRVKLEKRISKPFTVIR